jgi:hypothetical protein
MKGLKEAIDLFWEVKKPTPTELMGIQKVMNR